jgi:hypothetical protein
MKDINFHIENIKRSIDALAQMDSDKDVSEAVAALIQYPNFQTLFNMKLKSKVIHERELCELIGLKRGALEIADHVFQLNDRWGMNRSGEFIADTSSDNNHNYPISTFVFSIVEADDNMEVAKDINTWVVGLMKPGEDIVYKVQFHTHRNIGCQTMVNILARLAPDFKVFSTKL